MSFEIRCRYDGPSMHEAPAEASGIKQDLSVAAHQLLSAAHGDYEEATRLLKTLTLPQEPL